VPQANHHKIERWDDKHPLATTASHVIGVGW
jgi:hypothetical protein